MSKRVSLILRDADEAMSAPQTLHEVTEAGVLDAAPRRWFGADLEAVNRGTEIPSIRPVWHRTLRAQQQLARPRADGR